jgi:hypothetical protein
MIRWWMPPARKTAGDLPPSTGGRSWKTQVLDAQSVMKFVSIESDADRWHRGCDSEASSYRP